MSILERLEEVERRLDQMNVRGTIDAVDCDAQRVRVRYGPDSVTDWIEFKPVRSGLVTIWCPPQVGEGCTIIADGDLNRGEVILGSYHQDMPTPSTNPDETVILWPDGTRIVYDMKRHKLTLTVAGDVIADVSGSLTANVQGDVNTKAAGNGTIDCGGSCSVKAGGKCSVDGSSVVLGGGGGGVVTGKHICAFTGKPHSDCSGKVSAG
ncbi:MAG: phage baseplate assembly protein V [Aeromonadaceae bacterium]